MLNSVYYSTTVFKIRSLSALCVSQQQVSQFTCEEVSSPGGWGGGYSLYSDDRDDRRIF